jgi:acyl transferase domain-containing protein
MSNEDYSDVSERDIAVVGMSGRFPGAGDIDAYWRNLRDGVEAITFFSDEELRTIGVGQDILDDPHYVKAGAILEDIECFDAPFFNFNPREAELLDPQQRLLLEEAWAALEDAGYVSEEHDGLVGVYASVAWPMYLLTNLYWNLRQEDYFQVFVTNDKDFAPTRISYKLNLKGPSFAVQTACSSALVAIHLACLGLLNYECDMALAGGAAVKTPHRVGYFYQEGGQYSPDGHCRAFDARSQGTIFGNGVGMVVLKRLVDAVADGDHIYALVKGSAVNNDGSIKASYTAPSVEGQAEAIAAAQAMADVEPETVGYVETHGTGTAIGDPIEVAALTRVFQARTEKKGFCAIGSVKTNLGHLETAAGAAGFIKTVLALKHKMIPPTLHFEKPNPRIDFENSPFYVNAELQEWKADGGPRRAGVSSFGVGGTNAHVIVEEAPALPDGDPGRGEYLLLLSAKTEEALEQMTANLAAHLHRRPEENLADVAYTLQVGRRAFNARRMVICRDLDEAVNALEGQCPDRVLTHSYTSGAGSQPVAFMFPGLGDQYVNMARGLYRGEIVFREWVDRCSEVLLPHLAFDLRDVLFADRESESPRDEVVRQEELDLRKMVGRVVADDEADPLTSRLNQTHVAHLALFVVEYALAQLWMSWGIKPQAVLGYSLGEYVAACLAGVFSLEEALQVVFRRARMIETLPEGAMMAVALSEDEVSPWLGESLSLSAINGPQMCVVSGSPGDIQDLSERLAAEGVTCRLLKASRAFHSQMVEPILGDFREFVQTLELKPPEIPYVSNLTGTWITPEQATDPEYWVTHTRQPVHFADGIAALWAGRGHILLEVGIGQTLGSLALQHPAGGSNDSVVVLSSLPSVYDKQSDLGLLLRSLGQMWLAGIPIDWPGFYAHERRLRCSLPSYPFERRRYWVGSSIVPSAVRLSAAEPEAGKKPDLADWFYVPTWRRMPLVHSNHGEAQGQQWLFFVDESGLGMSLVDHLCRQGERVITVTRGESFRHLEGDAYEINPQESGDYAALIDHLFSVDKSPSRIVHLWNVTADEVDRLDGAVDLAQQLGFYSLIFLAQALGSQPGLSPTDIWVVSSEMQDVLGGETVYPAKSTLLGPCKVIPQEYGQVNCSSVDIHSATVSRQKLVEQLLAEFMAGITETVVAYRGQSRWVHSFEPLQLKSADQGFSRLREKGVYLITGGFGGLGHALAERLAETLQARLILVGRTNLPPRESWSAVLAKDAEDEGVCRRIRQVVDLEERGAQVLVATADVTDKEQVQRIVDDAREHFGAIHGVFHLAAVFGEGLIQIKTREMASRVLAPKLQGTLALNAALQDEPLDFMVLYSSVSAVVGGLGEVAYCAANVFLDAFAHYNWNVRSTPTFSVNWGSWRWIPGERDLAPLPQVYERLKQTRERYGITFDEGYDALKRVLTTCLPQLLVLTRDLETFSESDPFESMAMMDEIQTAGQSGEMHPRPNLRTAYVPPGNETEAHVARLWQNVLGVEAVGIHDNFLELGGNSLLGIQLLSRLRRHFEVDLPLRVLFEAPTVANMALAVEDLLIREIEELAEEDIVAHLEDE